MTEKYDLSVIKMSLEHASFDDFRVREGVLDLIKNFELDMEDVGFEPSEQTKDTINELVKVLDDVEAPRKIKSTSSGAFHLPDVEEIGRKVLTDINDSVTKLELQDNLPVRKIRNVDEELLEEL